MSGHNKWSKIKHTKAKEDSKKGKIFSKAIKDIVKAARLGGPNPANNSLLRSVIEKAKSASVPSKNIQRALDRISGDGKSTKYESITYEGYSLGGVAVMIECLTDNKNRTASLVRSSLSKFGGSLGMSGCVSWMFESLGMVYILSGDDDDNIIDIALDSGALDIVELDDKILIKTSKDNFQEVLKSLQKASVKIDEASLDLVPQNIVETAKNIQERVEKMIDFLEDQDDVINVYHNMKRTD